MEHLEQMGYGKRGSPGLLMPDMMELAITGVGQRLEVNLLRRKRKPGLPSHSTSRDLL